MEITAIKMRLFDDDSKLKAIASLTFDEEFVLHDVKVIDGADKLFLAMPSRRTADGKYRDIAHPITPELRGKLESQVLEYYRQMKAGEAESGPDET